MIKLHKELFFEGSISMIIETERLYFEPLGSQDLDALKQILQNGKTMESYGGVRSDEECSQWIDRQQRYEQLGYGIWSILRKDTRQMIGQGGLVYHNWKKEPVLDLVYIIKNEYWQQGYGKEAAAALERYAFETLDVEEVNSIIRDTNEYSQIISLGLGMEVIDRKTDVYRGVSRPHYLYNVKRNK